MANCVDRSRVVITSKATAENHVYLDSERTNWKQENKDVNNRVLEYTVIGWKVFFLDYCIVYSQQLTDS